MKLVIRVGEPVTDSFSCDTASAATYNPSCSTVNHSRTKLCTVLYTWQTMGEVGEHGVCKTVVIKCFTASGLVT
jgi:hypothetical protein